MSVISKKKFNRGKRPKGLMAYFPIKEQAMVFCAKDYGYVSASEVETCRRMLRRLLTKQVKFMTCIFTERELSCKPTGVRMGKGKGSKLRVLAGYVKPGRALFKVWYAKEEKSMVREVLFKMKKKVSIQTEVFNKNY